MQSRLVVYPPAPEESLSEEYTVSVNSMNVPVYQALLDDGRLP